MDELVVEFDRMVAEKEWEPTNASNKCRRCGEAWSAFKWKHHCRNCGQLVCDVCSSARVRFRSGRTAERCCVSCYSLLRALLLSHIHTALPVVEVHVESEPVLPQVQGRKDSCVTNDRDTAPTHLVVGQNADQDELSLVPPASPTELSSEAWLLYDESLKFSTDDASVSEKALTATGQTGTDAVQDRISLDGAELSSPASHLTKRLQSERKVREVEERPIDAPPLSPPELRLQRQLDCLTDEQLERLFSKLSKILYKDDEDWGACEQPERLLQEILMHPEEFFDKDGKLFCAT